MKPGDLRAVKRITFPTHRIVHRLPLKTFTALVGVVCVANVLLATALPSSLQSTVYSAHIETLTRSHVRYNVVSWQIARGAIPRTYTVTLYYLGGRLETFHWVISYRFEPQRPPAPPVQYLQIARIDYVPPNIYFITVEAKFAPCFCISHTISLEAAYKGPDPSIPIIIPIKTWPNIPNDGRPFSEIAQWGCPHEGWYEVIARGSHNLEDRVTRLMVPEFSNVALTSTVGIVASIAILRIQKKRPRTKPGLPRDRV